MATDPSPKRPWPPLAPFPESRMDSLGEGSSDADFPASAGGRELGKFRPGRQPRTTKVAVSNDDGTPVGFVASEVEQRTEVEMRAIRLGIQLLLNQMTDSDIDLLDMATNL